LDSVRSDQIMQLLRRLADAGQTIVMATHDARAAAYADRSVRLLDGRIE
jgi:putative ABC transport system ATP-binding protein